MDVMRVGTLAKSPESRSYRLRARDTPTTGLCRLARFFLTTAQRKKARKPMMTYHGHFLHLLHAAGEKATELLRQPYAELFNAPFASRVIVRIVNGDYWRLGALRRWRSSNVTKTPD